MNMHRQTELVTASPKAEAPATTQEGHTPFEHHDATRINVRGPSEEFIADCAAAPDLLEALEECSRRLRSCAIAGGTDEEYADIAVEKYTVLIARARGEIQ